VRKTLKEQKKSITVVGRLTKNVSNSELKRTRKLWQAFQFVRFQLCGKLKKCKPIRKKYFRVSKYNIR